MALLFSLALPLYAFVCCLLLFTLVEQRIGSFFFVFKHYTAVRSRKKLTLMVASHRSINRSFFLFCLKNCRWKCENLHLIEYQWKKEQTIFLKKKKYCSVQSGWRNFFFKNRFQNGSTIVISLVCTLFVRRNTLYKTVKLVAFRSASNCFH